MKRIMSLLLALLLIAAILPAGALAADVVLSPQGLRVNGKRIECEKYNIDGSNYFKLRDLAYMLNGTGSQFSVGWDGEKKVVSLVTGEAYEPNGSELDLSGGDKSATAAPSADAIIIDGVERSDIQVYKLGGNNFFKLRDLDEALGFKVNYDKPSNTAIIISRAAVWPAPWLTEVYDFSGNDGSYGSSTYHYNELGQLVSSVSEGWDYKTGMEYTYDDLGREIKNVETSVYNYDGAATEERTVTTREFDKWGQCVSVSSEGTGDVVSGSSFTYDDNGNLIASVFSSNSGSTAYYDEYDENGFLVRESTVVDGEVIYTNDYVNDADGNILYQRGVGADGEISYEQTYTYENGRMVKSVYSYGDYVVTNTYAYDESGRQIRTATESPYGTSWYSYIYNDQGLLLQEEWGSGDTTSGVRVMTRDGEGRLLRDESSNETGVISVEEYTYDADGNVVKTVSVYGSIHTERIYTYDKAARSMHCVETTTYPPAEALVINDWVNLAVGETYYLYYYYLPESATDGLVTWSSSDPGVVTVDKYGMLTAIADGEAVVTGVSASGLSASCTVVVGAVG